MVVYELAGVIGARVGASRAAGWIAATSARSIKWGQTGPRSARPCISLLGISGAVQHRAGMEESAKIIAVNTDPNAPIFSVAHYGIVGDMNKVVPLMIKALRERK